jgi:ribonuclease T
VRKNNFLQDLPACISVDVETAGPNPNSYALLSIGACTVTQPRKTFYVELKPDHNDFQPQAIEIHGLDLARLTLEGEPPKEALIRFEQWLKKVVPDDLRPIFLAFNAPFDWMFVNDYFHRYIGHNPFGHNALDIKAFYMGASGASWKMTSGDEMRKQFLGGKSLTHNALQDAIEQAVIFEQILDIYYNK